MMDIEKRLHRLNERSTYIKDIFDGKQDEAVRMLQIRLDDFQARMPGMNSQERHSAVTALEELFAFMEHKLDEQLSPMDKVRIVRHPQRICLRDILENVYDNYTEIGGQDDKSIDPSMLIARAYITRRRGKALHNQPVMVIGQETGHGEEFRNGGSVKPWGNAKALQYMKVAEIENIPVHTFVFTPGSYPIEDYPGAAQQIARNLYEMAGLRVPVISVFSEGGSGGAEAIGLADKRLMLSHGYYSVISPEGAAAIEGRLRGGARATPELIERCATQLKMTADDNLNHGLIDLVVREPSLGAKPYHYEFFQSLRNELMRVTDEVVLSTRPFALLRNAVNQPHRPKSLDNYNAENFVTRWSLSSNARERLVALRQKKFRFLSTGKWFDPRTASDRMLSKFKAVTTDIINLFRHDLWGRRKKQLGFAVEEMDAGARMLLHRVFNPVVSFAHNLLGTTRHVKVDEQELTTLSSWHEEDEKNGTWSYLSSKAKEDRAVTCPNAEKYGCLDLWSPDLYGEFAGVCTNCGYHFPMGYKWFMYNVFDPRSIVEFNKEIEAANPLEWDGFDAKLESAKQKTGLNSGCITFEASISNTKMAVALLVASFRGGSVGVAEGEKFLSAVEWAQRKRLPMLAYVHGTAGIRIQEGTNGVIQMPRCTMGVRRYIDAGGLYLVLYDTNSYAGPVASFLGCSPYQFAIRSSNVGFAGRGVIKETTGMDIPPDYHNAEKALSRGHIQGIWDRREARANLQQAMITMGGRNLYYKYK